jgi:hypothetical protein
MENLKELSSGEISQKNKEPRDLKRWTRDPEVRSTNACAWALNGGTWSGGLRQFLGHGDIQVGLMDPASGVGSPVPALERHARDVLAFLIIKHFEESSPQAAPHLRGRAVQVQQLVGPIIEDGNCAPALGLRFRLVEHV